MDRKVSDGFEGIHLLQRCKRYSTIYTSFKSSFYCKITILVFSVGHNTISGQQVFDFSVSSADGSDETRKTVDDLLAGGSTSFFVDFSDVELDGGLILSVDDLVGSSALSGDVEIDEFSLIVVSTFSLVSEVAG